MSSLHDLLLERASQLGDFEANKLDQPYEVKEAQEQPVEVSELTETKEEPTSCEE